MKKMKRVLILKYFGFGDDSDLKKMKRLRRTGNEREVGVDKCQSNVPASVKLRISIASVSLRILVASENILIFISFFISFRILKLILIFILVSIPILGILFCL